MIDVFVDELDLATLGFEDAAATGRPRYHPRALLKLYLYGYMNQVQSSRRLEREAGRNVEVMWLTGKLAPDFKMIADFRRDNGEAVRAACKQFVVLCREIGLIAGGTVAADGSRFKAVNTRDKNYTPGAIHLRLAQVEARIERYLDKLDTADRQEADVAEMRTMRLNERIEALRQQMRTLQAMAHEVETAPDRQISLTDPDARAMATNGKGTGLVGYNVQAAVDTDSHIVVAHEVTNLGHDRTQLANMGRQAKDATGVEHLTNRHGRPYTKGGKTGPANKLAIVLLVERGGSVRSFHPAVANKPAVVEIVKANIAAESKFYTDESRLYTGLSAHFGEHSTVKHSHGEYARGVVHTNTIEGYFSIFKRGMKGIYQHCAEKHLHRYLAEFDFRYNHRIAVGYGDYERSCRLVEGMAGKRRTYRRTDGAERHLHG